MFNFLCIFRVFGGETEVWLRRLQLLDHSTRTERGEYEARLSIGERHDRDDEPINGRPKPEADDKSDSIVIIVGGEGMHAENAAWGNVNAWGEIILTETVFSSSFFPFLRNDYEMCGGCGIVCSVDLSRPPLCY